MFQQKNIYYEHFKIFYIQPNVNYIIKFKDQS